MKDKVNALWRVLPPGFVLWRVLPLEIKILRVLGKLFSRLTWVERKIDRRLQDRLQLQHLCDAERLKRQKIQAARGRGDVSCAGPDLGSARVLRRGDLQEGDHVLVLVIFTPDGTLSHVHLQQIGAYLKVGFRIVLVVNTLDPENVLPAEFANLPLDGVPSILIRENIGFDFAGWSHAIVSFGEIRDASTVSFANDSILPLRMDALESMVARLRSLEGATFLIKNHQVIPHGQSYFFSFSQSAIKSGGLLALLVSGVHGEKTEVIFSEEIFLSDRIRSMNIPVNVLYADLTRDVARRRNAVVHVWEELLRDGFPFIKILRFTSGSVDVHDKRLDPWMSAELRADLEDHVERRRGAVLPVNVTR